LEQLSKGTQVSSTSALSEDEPLKAIQLVDDRFESSRTTIRIVFLGTLSPLIVAGFGFLWFARFFADLAAQAAGAGLTDTGVGILSLSVAASAIGLSILVRLLTLDWDQGRSRLARRYLFWRLKASGIDPLTLHALIMMRATLPKDTSLEEAYNRNKAIFAADQLVLQLLKR
jgi:hypothetical protein